MCKKLRAVLMVVMMFLLAVPATAYAQTNGEEDAQESESTESAESAEEVTLETNTFSEDGNATLGDSATSADDKEFITVTTREGNVFYLVIDHQREDNNVYFLNMVDAGDLQAFVEEGEESGLDSIVSLPKETEPEPETTAETKAESEDTTSGDVVTDGLAEAQGGSNLNYLIVIVLAGVLGTAYYFKIHKKKQQSAYDEYETEEEYEEDTEYEQDDEQVEETEDEYEEDEADDSDEQTEIAAREEAKRQAKLETERQERLEQERIRKEKIREKREQLEAQSRKLEEEQKRLHEEQQRLEDEQEKLQAEQEEADYGEEGVF